MSESTCAFDDALIAGLQRWDLPIRPDQLGLLRSHYEAMIAANRSMNLTRIVEPVEAAAKHYVDSLALLLWENAFGVTGKCSLLDVGTGAGFPAFPLAVMRPNWSITAIDSTGKKIDFVKRVASEIGVKNLHGFHARSEHWQPQRTFDIVAMRAIGKMAKGIRQTAHLVAPGGHIVVYKSASMSSDESDEASSAARKLGLLREMPMEYELQTGSERLRRALHVFARPR